MDQARFKEITGKFKDKSILVVGDLMLDQYLWGTAERISPEAPVPIVRIEATNNLPGGAGNVALNLAKLNCRTHIAGFVGDDEQGAKLSAKLSEAGLLMDSVTVCHNRPTTVKTRIIAQNQQILRTDREELSAVDGHSIKILIERIKSVLSDCDGLIIADYNKGVLSTDLIVAVQNEAAKYAVPVYVDPKADNFFVYQ